MFDQPLFTGDRDEILRAIRHVRNRWRLRVALRGVAVLLAAALGTLVLSSWGLEVYRFTPAAIITFRVLTYAALLGCGWWFFIRPVSRRVSDEQVALYLEEHEPSLQATVLSAVEETHKGERSSALDHSPVLVGRLIESAVEKIRDVDMGRAVEHQKIQGSSGWLGAAAVVAILLFLFGPSYLRHGVMALLTPMASAETSSPYQIDVLPGDATVARGADQAITASLDGFGTDEVTLFMRSNSNEPFERLALIPLEEPGEFEVLLFDVQDTTDYFVEALGVQSGTFTLNVIDLPYVERLEHEYFFPAYTGLEPRVVEDGGDIAVLAGTEVRLRAVPTMPTPGGRLVLDEENRTELVVQPDGSLTGGFVVEKDGFYRIDLQGSQDEMVTASPQYTIDVLTDQPPSVMFLNPGRDTTASAIEELFVEARADDDFGLRSLDLVYSVNGGAEETVGLYNGGEDALKEVSAGHTFFLEDLDLEPGDFVSYYARATDRNLAQENRDIKSDLYFIQVRAFSRDFRAAQSQGGGGGGGAGGGADPRALSEAQKEIVSGTFNVVRDRDTYSDEEYQENVVFLTLAQGRLREQVETLLRRMNSRVMPADPAFRSISEILPQAADAMGEAEGELQRQDADGALPPEQRALQYLQRAEEAYEEVMVQMGGGGGGGGGQNQAAQDLADLFELELDKLQNQYETMERGEQQQADNTVDELMERLRELARRQEREAERQRMRSRGQQSAQGSGTAAQRELAEEAEEAARRLERLAREQNSPQMMDAARRLQEAADAMRRAAANNDNLGFAEAGAALDRLRDVQDRLRQEQTGRLERDIEEALRRANRLADEEREIASGVNALPDLSDEQQLERLQGLMERKDAMETEVADLERQIDSTSAEFRREERGASSSLQDASNSIRDNKLKEKIRYTKGVIRSRASDTARAFEDQITNDIEDLREHLRAAADAVGDTTSDAMAEALDQTRDLMRGLESLEHRMWEQDESQQGQEGQQGQQGQEGQQGQQAENGQQGQQGQQAGRGQQGGEQPGAADGQAGVGDSLGGAYAGGGYGNRRPTEFNPDDIRQWQSEIRQRLGEAQDISRLLEGEQFAAGDLEEIIRRMQQLDDTRVYQDSEEIARLQTYLREELKRFEYRLRREVDVENEELFLASSDEVPPGFRDMIEEYYRALSREN